VTKIDPVADAADLAELEAELRLSMGFMSDQQSDRLARLNGTRDVLLRFHEAREVVPAAFVRLAIRRAEGRGWNLRDVSLPSTDALWAVRS